MIKNLKVKKPAKQDREIDAETTSQQTGIVLHPFLLVN